MNRPELGQRVRIMAKVKQNRRYPVEKVNGWHTGYPRRWVREEIPSVEGIFIGYRTKFDGLVWWEDDEVGNVFCQTDHHEVWLVVIHPCRNPVPCFPEDVLVVQEAAK